MVVVLVFVICNSLAMISNILELFEVCAVPVTIISNFLVTFNSSVNLCIYCAFGERFRNELKRLTNRIKKKMFRCFDSNHGASSQDVSFLHKNRTKQVVKSKSLPEIVPGHKNSDRIGQRSQYRMEVQTNSNFKECDKLLNSKNSSERKQKIDSNKCPSSFLRHTTIATI